MDRAVINTAWLGSRSASGFQAILACRAHRISAISYQFHTRTRAWTLAGRWKPQAALPALPQLGPVFWLAAGDVFAPDFVFDAQAVQAFEASGHLAHLWLVPNPAHNPRGDFGLSATGLALNLPADDPRRATPTAPSRCCAPSCLLPLVRYPAGQPGGHGPAGPPCCAAPWMGARGGFHLHRAMDGRGHAERLAELNR